MAQRDNNIRNLALDEGELNAFFTTLSNIQASLRNEVREERRPLLATYEGAISKLSSMFKPGPLTSNMINKTGKSPKLTLMALAEYICTDSLSNLSHHPVRSFYKNILIEVGVPKIVEMSVVDGYPASYGSPAISEVEYQVQSGFDDRSSAVQFMNRQGMNGRCEMTAAALQMANDYMEHFLLPKLNGGSVGIPLNDIEAKDRHAVPDDLEESFLPSDLVSYHSSEALGIVHRALEAKDVLARAGYPTTKSRVFNKCPGLRAGVGDERDFWEAWNLLKHVSCGSSNTAHWDIDFLLLFIQNFPLHGTSDEGGIYRQLFKNIAVCPNKCVVTTKFSAQSQGYHNITSGQVIGASITLQSVVSRVLIESKAPNELFIFAPGDSDNEIRMLLTSVANEVCHHLVSATGMSFDYWSGILSVPPSVDLSRDRHLSTTNANYLRGFSTAVP